MVILARTKHKRDYIKLIQFIEISKIYTHKRSFHTEYLHGNYLMTFIRTIKVLCKGGSIRSFAVKVSVIVRLLPVNVQTNLLRPNRKTPLKHSFGTDKYLQ